MAKRYGGDYSPDPTSTDVRMDPNSTPFRGAKVDAAGARSNILFATAIVVAATSLNKGALGLTLGLTSAAALTLGAWLMRDGLRAAAAYEERRTARRPAIPRKLFSAVITGLGVAFAAFRNDGQVMAATIYGTCAGVLMIAAFGYRGKSYRFVINARTGQVQGERPYSAWKIAFAVLIGLAIAACVGYLAAQQQGV